MRSPIRTTLAAASATALVSIALVACSPSASPTNGSIGTEPPISSVPAAPSGSESPSASPSESPES